MRLLLAIGLFLFVAACATGPTYNVATSGLASPKISQAQTYTLWPMNEGVQPSDLQFQEYSAYVARALNSRGFNMAQEDETPDMVVLLGYVIGEPEKHVQSYNIPIFGQTGIASSTTTGTANTNVYGTSSYATGITNYNQTTTYTPSYGITGYNSGVQTFTTFTRFIMLSAAFFDAESEDWEPAFETTITSTGSSGDLRQVFPVMVAAAAEKIALNTGQAEMVSLGESDPRVLAIRGTPE